MSKLQQIQPKSGKKLLELINKYSKGLVRGINIIEDKIYNSKDTYEIGCNVHNWHPITKKYMSKISHKVINCKACSATTSNNMLIAYKKLYDEGIKYELEYPIKTQYRNTQFIDILIRDTLGREIFIEIDGEHHTQPVNWGKATNIKEQTLQKVQERDIYKNKYAEENNIPLHRINYNENVEEKIKEIINKYNFYRLPKNKTKNNFNKMHTAEREAYFIHEMHRAGKTNTEISKELNILQSKVSKILYGERFKSVFFHFYPDGENLLGRKDINILG